MNLQKNEKNIQHNKNKDSISILLLLQIIRNNSISNNNIASYILGNEAVELESKLSQWCLELNKVDDNNTNLEDLNIISQVKEAIWGTDVELKNKLLLQYKLLKDYKYFNDQTKRYFMLGSFAECCSDHLLKL